MSQNIKEVYEANFNKALKELNPKQKEAVEIIDGPVLVVAGPGTGKTQLLAARVGHILKSTDTLPRNILCLTFTDAGVVSMRNRLLQFIGPEAYNVQISTFHSFCNQVIKENITYFGGYRDLQNISELELVDILHEIIDGFDDDHPLRRFKGDIYYERDRLKNLFNIMKQESWTSDNILEALGQYESYLEDQEDFQYKRKYKEFSAGDPNPNKIIKELNKVKPLLSAVHEFNRYNELMLKRSRFDYNDMILWVLDQFSENPDLLADYQERFQYILVDEYQDTNGSQNELLFTLADFWDDPNLFVVGDDDQSIYRFQGANMNNIVEFNNRFNPKIIILDQNYRSSQEILDKSKILIDHNQERLVSQISGLQKDLKESRKEGLKIKPRLIEYHNQVHENYGIAKQILELKNQGVALNRIGVLYRKHANASDLIKYLMIKNVPIKIKRKRNALEIDEVQRLLNILKYLNAEYKRNDSGEHFLFDILHYEYFGLSAREVGKLAIYCSRKTDVSEDNRKWRDVLADKEQLAKAEIKNIDGFISLGLLLEEWINNVANLTLQVLFEKILTHGKVIETIMKSPDTAWRLQVVNTLFDFIKNESAKNPKINLSVFIEMIDKMEMARIELPLQQVTYAEEGVQMMTVHGSKGLEFDYVFLLGANEKNWEKMRGSSQKYSFPKNMVPASEESNIEDDRRLFYVGMTRAENHLNISYSKESEEGKSLTSSRFIHELVEEVDEIETVQYLDEEILSYQAELMKFHQGKVELIDHMLIDRVLEDYKMSVTHLNKYLDCPLKFYFENILRVPLARSKSMGFGNAMHYAMERFFISLEENVERKPPSQKDLIEYFRKGMSDYRSHFTDAEYSDLRKYGEKCLTAYYDNYKHEWSTPKSYKPEYQITLTEYKGVPITGKLDLVKVYDDRVEVFDYKTGKIDNALKKLKGPSGDEDLGGDYWRQLVFYKLLISGDSSNQWNMTKGFMDFLEPKDEEFKRQGQEIEEFEIDIVESQLVSSYQSIKNHEFEKGCDKPECKWCAFVKDNFVLNDELEGYVDEEEN